MTDRPVHNVPSAPLPPSHEGEVRPPGLSRTLLGRLKGWWRLDNPVLLGSLIIVTVGLALFVQTLWFIPTDIDDVVVFSSAARTSQPFTYLVNDVGLGKNEYRPLHAMSVWVSYRLVGVRASFHQTINIVLHLANAVLLFILLTRLNRNYFFTTIFALMFLVSLYVVSPASWISDRPTLLVSLAVILLLFHVVEVRQGRSPFRFSIFLGTTALGLLSKESGMLFPVSGLFLGYLVPLQPRARIRLQAASVVILAGYIVFRLFVFGQEGFSYRDTGYILGSLRYEGLSALPLELRLYGYVENTLKNVVAVIAPVFDNQGRPELPSPFPAGVVALFCSVALISAALRHRLTAEQKVAVLLILVNALIHATVFRHRTLYLVVICFAVFLSSAAPFADRSKSLLFPAAMVVVIIMANIALSSHRLVSLSNMRYNRGQDLQVSFSRASVGHLADRVDPDVLEAIKRRYLQPPE